MAESSEFGEIVDSPQANMTTSKRDETLAKFEIATLAVIFIVAVAGNSLMLVALKKILVFRPMSRMYFFMLNLSIADLFVAFGNILPQLAWDVTFRFRGPDILCRLVKFLQVFVLYLSSLILTGMAVDRYLVVCRSTFSRNYYGALNGPKILVIVSYVLAFLLATPQAFIFSIKDIQETPESVVQDCWVEFIEPWGAKAYVLFFITAAVGIPLVIIGFSYGAICYKVARYQLPMQTNTARRTTVSLSPTGAETSRERRRLPSSSCTLEEESSFSNNTSENHVLRKQISQAKLKTLKLTLVVVVCFFGCWAPFCACQVFMVFNPQPAVGPLQVILLLLASLNSCANPWIYLAFSESLCNQLRLLFGLGLKRGSDDESIGEDAQNQNREDDPHLNRTKKDDFALLNLNSTPDGTQGYQDNRYNHKIHKASTNSDLF